MKHTGNYESSRRSNTLRCSDFRVKLYVDSAPEKADQRMPKVQDYEIISQSISQAKGRRQIRYLSDVCHTWTYIGSYCVCRGAEQFV